MLFSQIKSYFATFEHYTHLILHNFKSTYSRQTNTRPGNQHSVTWSAFPQAFHPLPDPWHSWCGWGPGQPAMRLPLGIILHKPRTTTWSKPCSRGPCSADLTREHGPTGRRMGRGSRDTEELECIYLTPPTVPIQMMMSLNLTSALINSLKHPASMVKMHLMSCKRQIRYILCWIIWPNRI